jgi:alkanesulfonate monooxygenase SsuD/methylene tetrahydromethanopterin reductase-like flavin-dependent oxidoreductase (luciferase family)
MKFSLLFEIQISEPTPAKERERFHQAVQQAVLAEELGYDGIWVVEHHGMLEYSHSSAPEILLAYIAAKTNRIRLGQGVCLTPHRYNHPIRVAERIATLDILSGGRISLGMGKSASLTEQMAFEIDPDELQGQWMEALDMIPRMWIEDVFQYRGEYFNVPPTQILPKPVQGPHPPLHAACNRPEASEKLGELGLGAMNLAVGSDAYLKQLVDSYRDALGTAQNLPYHPTSNFACAPLTCCLEDDEEACKYGMRGQRFFSAVMSAYYFENQRPLGALDLPRDFLNPTDLEQAKSIRGGDQMGALNLIGDPQYCREIIQRYEDAGVDELMLLMQLGTIPDSIVQKSIRCFGEEVLPHFQNDSSSLSEAERQLINVY